MLSRCGCIFDCHDCCQWHPWLRKWPRRCSAGVVVMIVVNGIYGCENGQDVCSAGVVVFLIVMVVVNGFHGCGSSQDICSAGVVVFLIAMIVVNGIHG